MAPIKSTKFGYMSIFTDKVETDNNIAGIGATYSTTEVFEPGNGYRYLIYTAPGYLNVNRGGSVDLLLVGGGGAGGNGEWAPPDNNYGGGGGGAGGYFQDFNFTLPIGEYDISIGSGGAAGPLPASGQPGAYRNGNPGSPSYISGPGITTITAYGGGGGGGSYDSPGGLAASGSDGGSGGGRSNNPSSVTGQGNRTTASAPVTGSPIPAYLQGSGEVQGYPGGPEPVNIFIGSAGGGAGGAGGGPGAGYYGGIGRAAWTNDAGIPPAYGTPGPTPGRWFAGGGGGGHPYFAPSSSPPSTYFVETGGAGGGGRGADGDFPGTQPAANGTTNTGGGGGGGSGSSHPGAGTGGPGIVIIRYKIS